MAAEPFTIAIPEESLEDLRARLRQTRWATDFGNDDWRYGANEEYLHEFVDYGVSVDVARRNNSLVGPWPSNGKTIFV